MHQSPKHFYDFGPFRLDLSQGELLRDGQRVPLPPKVFETLRVLVENHGRIVEKDDLIKQVWPDTFVEEGNLSLNIFLLRKLLSERLNGVPSIETIPKRGYRFVAPVETAHLQADPETSPPESDVQRQSPGAAVLRPLWKTRSRFVALMAAIALILTVIGTSLFLNRRQTGVPKVLPLTGLSGLELQASFSPDGNQVAYAWNGGAGDITHIYVKLIGAGTPLQLTSGSRPDGEPSWSPDGRYISFLRYSGQGTFATEYRGLSYDSGEVVLIPALGGPERHLGQVSRPIFCSRDLTWSPDGRSLVVGDKPSPDEPSGLFVLSLENGEKHRITSTPHGGWWDSDPSFSPDGRRLAFVHWSGPSETDIYVQNVLGNTEARRVTFDEGEIAGLAWTPDSRGIVFSSDRSGIPILRRVRVSGGEIESWTGIGEDSYIPAVSPRGNLLAYTRATDNTNIWRIAATRSALPPDPRFKLISGPGEQVSCEFSPNGKRIVFASDRSGDYEIWVASSDGSNPVQLTSFRGRNAGTPHWSPDGRWIAFDAVAGGTTGVFVVSTEGGMPRRVTPPSTHGVAPNWSRDGKRIYFCSNRSGHAEVWKIPVEGGEAVQVTKTGGVEAVESNDGRWLYFSRPDRPSIWKMPVEGGAETLALNRTTDRFWTLAGQSLYFMDLEAKPHATINRMDLVTGKITLIAEVEKNPPSGYSGLSVSPDGEWVIYPQIDEQSSSIMLVENFR